MKVLRNVAGLVPIGVVLMLAATLVTAGLWLYPVTSEDHGGGAVPKCTPIVELFQYNDRADGAWSDLCYFPARRRVSFGAAGGLLLGGAGLVLLVAGRRASRHRKMPPSSEGSAPRLVDA